MFVTNMWKFSCVFSVKKYCVINHKEKLFKISSYLLNKKLNKYIFCGCRILLDFFVKSFDLKCEILYNSIVRFG